MIIQTAYGLVQGVPLDSETYVFRGIPYAAPPVGPLRFKPPIQPQAWGGIRLCDTFGPISHQRHDPTGTMPELVHSEDCLNLNIWTSGRADDPKPVIVYIHGGGFMTGKGAECDGARYAAEDDIVYVSVNYRLGSLGFLYMGELLGEGYETSGNNGMLDIVAALQWVKDNIVSFGGDPNRVTVMGNSAGAKCTAALYTMKSAEGLFLQAVAQSGATQSIRDTATAGVTAMRLVAALGLKPENARKLLELPAERLIEAQYEVGPDTAGNLHMFGPVADGQVIPVDPLAWLNGQFRPLPRLLIGTNHDEADIFILNDPDLHMPSQRTTERLFGSNQSIVRDSYLHYLQSMPSDRAWSRTLTEHLYTIGCVQMANALAAAGTPVWMYRLQYGGALGATHGYEGSLITHVPREIAFSSCGNETDPYYVSENGEELACAMRTAWIAFVHTGDPNAAEAVIPHWPAYGEDRRLMLLDLESSVRNDMPTPIGIGCPHQVWREDR